MAAGSPNPNPRTTVWAILALTLFLLLLVGWLAVSSSSQGFFHLTSSGSTVPAAFVLVALLVGLACVALFVRRGSHRHPHQ